MKKRKLKSKVKKSASKFKSELRKSIITALMAAFGFLIALSWRDVIVSIMSKVSEANPIKNNVLSAFLITIICVIGILIVSKFSNDEEK